MRIGTKELKNRLSRYLELARAGEAIQVTSRGKVVVELRAVKPVVPRVVAGSPRLISAMVLEDRGGHV
ncbi:MAG: type II toxin-antitoxin system prevent-host-death family antitoxin [Polyangiaceae bacterium]|nr:type II toxin-antitoxin system prevent-host-death family antitoxin [Polyangiaceae bacterium]